MRPISCRASQLQKEVKCGELLEVDISEAQRIAELEEQVRALLAEKRWLEEKIEELLPPKIYVATLGEWFWREVQMGAVENVKEIADLIGKF